MFGRKSLLLILLTGAMQLSAADRKAVISPNASGASFTSPIVGYFWTQTDGLVTIEGIPGAAQVGRPRDLTFTPARVALPPGQAYVWMEDTTDGLSTAVANRELLGSDLISFSPNAASAALYFRSAGVVKIATGLPDSPSLAATVALPQSGCDVGALGMADDGATVMLGCGGNLYSAAADHVWHPVMPGNVAAMAFLPDSSDALVVMSGDSNVYGVTSGVRGQLPLGMNDPLSLAVSADGRYAVATDGAGNAASLDLPARQSSLLKVAQGLKTVQRARDASTFVLVSNDGGTPWIIDVQPGGALVSFAPRIPASNAGHGHN